MQGVHKASCYGLNVGCIATFTPYNAPSWREVFDFFLVERLNFSIHAAVPPLDVQDGQYAISADQYGRLLCEMLDRYVEFRREISVSSLDQMSQGLGCGGGKVCTFRDCLGMFLAIDPYGDVYPCQRFCGKPAYRLGKLADQPSLADLLASPVARRMAKRQEQMRSACAGCNHFDYCKGGCPYNAWAGIHSPPPLTGEGPALRGDADRIRDPYCPAYKHTFDKIVQRTMVEMASEENIEAVAARPYNGKGHPLLRKGPLIELVREGPHPSKIARTAKRIVAAVELARGPDIPAVATRLVRMGICRTQQSAEASLAGLQRDLQPKPGVLNNLYLHVTFGCQLHCTHCYARADATGHSQGQMGVDEVLSLVRQAKKAGFRQVIITGGEPLVHSQRDALLPQLAELRAGVAPMNLVLRTNFAMPLGEGDLRQIAMAFDQVVVSVDGNQDTHDARRGAGSYAAVVRNLEAYRQLTSFCEKTGKDDLDSRIRILNRVPGELSLACATSSADVQGEPGDAVRQLATRLDVRRTRFRPLLPLGRVKDWPEPPASEALGAYVEPIDLIESGFHPCSTCGFGQNLYVEPSGQAFPCYAYHKPHSYLGDVIHSGLRSVLDSGAFRQLCGHNVDVNPKCRTCQVRYLCGGACRAWGQDATQADLDAPPPECEGLQRRAAKLLASASHYLGVNRSKD